MRTCSRCRQEKPLTEFHKERRRRSGYGAYCRICNSEYGRAKYARNKAYYDEKNRRWQRENRERVRLNHVRRRFGLSPEDYLGLQERQGFACAICRAPFTHNPDVDHDHATGQVRGLLCGNCNKLLGYAHDSRDLLSAAVSYLARNS